MNKFSHVWAAIFGMLLPVVAVAGPFQDLTNATVNSDAHPEVVDANTNLALR